MFRVTAYSNSRFHSFSFRDRIESFISENRALTRRMFGEFPRPSDIAQEVHHFPDIENFQTVDFPESVRERYSVVEWATSEAKKSASESKSEASESTTIASEPGIATESSVPPIDGGVNGVETRQGGVQSSGEEEKADGMVETTVETPPEVVDQQSDASVMSEQSTKELLQTPPEDGKPNRSQSFTTSVLRPRPLGFFRIDSRPRTEQESGEASRVSWSGIDRLNARGTQRSARRPFLTRIEPTTTSVANQESTLSAATNQQPTVRARPLAFSNTEHITRLSAVHLQHVMLCAATNLYTSSQKQTNKLLNNALLKLKTLAYTCTYIHALLNIQNT